MEQEVSVKVADNDNKLGTVAEVLKGWIAINPRRKIISHSVLIIPNPYASKGLFGHVKSLIEVTIVHESR